MATKKKAVAIVPMAMPSSPRESLRIEKIDNGYLAHHSGSDGKGNYHEKTVYHPTAPRLPWRLPPAKCRSKRNNPGDHHEAQE
jgi:hypothetical protein